MTDHQHFKNPPITEALIDIRVNLNSDFDVNALEEFHSEIEKEFPVKEINTKWETSFTIKPGEAPITKAKDTKNGFIFKSSNGQKTVQARLDGFTFNKLKPYTTWKEFFSEAQSLWQIYTKLAKPERINRIGLRYINLIEIPLPISDIKEYITTAPDIADGMPQGVSELFMRLVIPDSKTNNGNVAIITQTIDLKKLSSKILPIIFDIDVFRILTTEIKDKEIWEIIESMREYKNLIFMKSLTDKAKDMFQ